MEASHGTVTKLLIISQLTFTRSSKSNQSSKTESFINIIVPHPSLLKSLTTQRKKTNQFPNSFLFFFADLWMTRKGLCLATMESCSDMLDKRNANKKG